MEDCSEIDCSARPYINPKVMKDILILASPTLTKKAYGATFEIVHRKIGIKRALANQYLCLAYNFGFVDNLEGKLVTNDRGLEFLEGYHLEHKGKFHENND